MVKYLLTLAVVLVTQSGDSSCTPLPKACALSFQGIHVQAGEVRDVVTPTCDLPPRQHVLHAWMEYKAIGEYSPLGRRQVVSRAIPDRTGFPVPVSAGTCAQGWYRAVVHVDGVGPSTTADPEGLPFDVTETGREKFITAQDCNGG
ncbi:MAG: hypothetical protein ACT4NY_05705 [Pseudonocardiales bacterium]